MLDGGPTLLVPAPNWDCGVVGKPAYAETVVIPVSSVPTPGDPAECELAIDTIPQGDYDLKVLLSAVYGSCVPSFSTCGMGSSCVEDWSLLGKFRETKRKKVRLTCPEDA